MPSWHVPRYVLAGQTLESADCAPVWRGEDVMLDLRTSYESGADRARVDYTAGDNLPTHTALAIQEFRALRVEHPYLPDSTIEAHAHAWANGWLSVAGREWDSWVARNW